MNSLLINSDQADKLTSSIVKKLYTVHTYICVCVRQGTGAVSGAICPTALRPGRQACSATPL